MNKKTTLLTILLLFTCITMASAQTFNTIIDDSFTRANTSAGTVTAPPTYYSPSTDAAYVTTGTATWQISSDTLVGSPANSNVGVQNVLRPTSEDVLSGEVAMTFTLNTNSNTTDVVGRYQTSGPKSYAAYYYQNGGSTGNFAVVVTGASGNGTIITSTTVASLTNGTSYIMVLKLIGASPTALTATIATAAAPGTILKTLTGSDSTSGLQVSGQWGISGGGTPGIITHLTTYQVAPAAITSSPTTAIVSTPETVTFTGANLLTNWSTSLPTITPSSGTLGTLTASSSTVVSGTYTPTSSTGAVTFTDSSDTGSPTCVITSFAGNATSYTSSEASSTGTTSVPVTLTFTGNGPTTATITPAVSGISGVFSPTTIALNGNVGVTVTFTPSTAGVGTISTTNSGSLTNPGNLTYTASYPTLTIGTFSATPTAAGISIGVTAGIASGSGSGYSYEIFRDTQPAVSTTGSPTFTTSTMPYVDTTATAGTLYFYKLIGTDSASDTANAAPTGYTGINMASTADMAVSGQFSVTVLNMVNVGDSITYGYSLSSPSTQAPPVLCAYDLQNMIGIRSVFYSNQGQSGFDTTNFLPGTNTGGCFTAVESAMTTLQSANTGTEIFSIMLGTNDSATTGPTSPARTAAQVATNIEAIITQLLTDFPSAKVIVNDPPLYTPNTYSSYDYEETGLARLVTYYPAYVTAVSTENGLYPGHVFLGDTTAPAFFGNNYSTELTAASGTNGNYYLHPSVQGALDLGRLWANAIYKDLYGSTSSSGRGRTLK